ncbi:glycosyltransferase family 2 protein [Actinosynnema sp. NPDC020468]|uniref:glycosyltransferase family 2 protein n=1 Tax=Actinosynnema sp. NPDC020468 TaxID=3154488 RepID=UPI0033D7A4E3
MAEPRLRVLQSPFQNAFFHELADALVAEATALGADAEVVTTMVETEPDDVFVLLPTHEYAALEGSHWLENERIAQRVIGITAEQPSSSHFDTNVHLGGRLAAVFDFSKHAVEAYEARGVRARHLQFGWTPSWDRFDATRERDLDVLFLGCGTPRREHALAKLGRRLWSTNSRLIISDNAAPNTSDHGGFVTGEKKRDLLAGTKVLLNIHQAEEPYFEWLRAVEAAHTGAVTLSETSLHTEPFVGGEHLEFSALSALPHRLDALLDDPDRLAALRLAAYGLIKETPFARGVERLLEVAKDVRRGARPVALHVGPTRPGPFRPNLVAPWERERDGTDVVRQAIREIRLDLVDLRRRVSADPSIDPTPVVDLRTPSWDRRPKPRVSVIMALYNHEPYVVEALESAASGSYTDLEIVVTDDGSTDGSGAAVREWMLRSPQVAATLVRHPVNRGLPRARNTSIAHARGELVFVLDADNAITPTGLERLVAALDADPEAAFAYGVLQRFDPTGPLGLMGVWPWEPWRFRYYNYIDAMALVRAEALADLGGYTVDRRLHGWEDYQLWCRIAENGGHAAHVQTVVGRYRSSATSMLSLTNVSTDAGYDALRESCPRVMSGALELSGDRLADWLNDVRGARTLRDGWLTDWERERA